MKKSDIIIQYLFTVERGKIMIFFGHLGPTALLVNLIDKAVINKNKDENKIDYRMVLIGSDLPDIIDKPIGALLFRGVFHNSRIFCHTLLFSGLLFIIGIIKARKSGNYRNNILILGFCSLIHQLLDSMWLYPKIFYWPLFGLKFPPRAEGNWAAEGLARLLTDPFYYVPEVLGIIIIMYYLIKLIKEGQLGKFVKNGKA